MIIKQLICFVFNHNKLSQQTVSNPMLPSQHSKIDELQSQQNSHSSMQSLNDLRELLPLGHPIATMENYSIQQSRDPHMSEHSWASQNSQQSRELMAKVMSQMHQLLGLREQLYYYRTQFFKVTKENNQLSEVVKNIGSKQDKHIEVVKELELIAKENHHQNQQLRRQNAGLRQQIQEKDKVVNKIQEQLAKLKASRKDDESLKLILHEKNKQIQSMEVELSKSKIKQRSPLKEVDHNIVQEMRYQSQIIMELTAKNEKVLKINAFLKEQLSMAENRLVKVQLEQQEQTCGLLLQNVSRLKENRNSVNHRYKDSIHNWQTLPYERSSVHLRDKFQSVSLLKQETVKLNSHRASMEREERRRQSRTVEKDRPGFITSSINVKLSPVEEPKPHRKSYACELPRQVVREKYVA